MLYVKPELKVIKVSELTQAGGSHTDQQGNVLKFTITEGATPANAS